MWRNATALCDVQFPGTEVDEDAFVSVLSKSSWHVRETAESSLAGFLADLAAPTDAELSAVSESIRAKRELLPTLGAWRGACNRSSRARQATCARNTHARAT